MKKPKILMIYTDWGTNKYRTENAKFGGCGYYRLYGPMQELKKWYDIDLMGPDINKLGKNDEEIWVEIYSKYDLVYPRHVSDLRAASNMMAMADYFGRPVIMDMDDNYLDVPPENPGASEYAEGTNGRVTTGVMLSLVNAVSLSTLPLVDVYSQHLKNAHGKEGNFYLLPNCNNIKDWDFPHTKSGKKTIGYMGSNTHNKDLLLVTPVIKRIMQEDKDVRFEVLGAISNEFIYEFIKEFKDMEDRVGIKGGTQAWEGYPELLSKQDWAVAIAPLEDTQFTRCKSHIKWMEYAMYEIPCVASKVYPYFMDIQGTQTIQDGQTGMLASTQEEWYSKLKFLLDNPKEGERIAKNAKQYIKENWQWSQHIHKWKEMVEKTLN